jgi:hypothetical protein
MQTLSIFAIILISLLPAADKVQVEWLSPTVHDFGDIRRNAPVTFKFEFRNTGSEPAGIDNVRTSCGCTVPDWPEAPIQPDSTGIISVEYDARDIGYFRKSIRVFFKGRRGAERLYIEGFVVE